jgi:hypothetical protein
MPMPVLNRIESSRSRGRVLELQQLVYAQGDIIGHESGFNELLSIKQQDYFEKNLSLLDAVVDDGQATGRYAISTQVFTERYATALKPIVRLRATFVDEIVNHILAERDAAFNRLIWVGVATLAALLILASLVQMIRMKILHPLLVARETITGLAESGGSLPLPTAVQSGKCAISSRRFTYFETVCGNAKNGLRPLRGKRNETRSPGYGTAGHSIVSCRLRKPTMMKMISA